MRFVQLQSLTGKVECPRLVVTELRMVPGHRSQRVALGEGGRRVVGLQPQRAARAS